MAKVNLFEWTDVLSHACTEKFGHDWNTFHDVLRDSGFVPMYECKKAEYHRSDFVNNNDAYGFPQDVVDVVLSFMDEENINEMTIV